MTLFADLVSVSARVGATRSRTAKLRELAEYLKSLPADEVSTAVHYLSGSVRQGRFGLSYRTLQAAAGEVAATGATLSLDEIDRRLQSIADLRGAGSAALRTRALRELFSSATLEEQPVLIRLIAGELRQGALEGVMVDAIAAAAAVPAVQLRRAAMYAPSLGHLAETVLRDGVEALEQFQLQLFSPIAPMLAQTASDPAEAIAALQREVDFEWKMDGARIQAHKRGDEVHLYTRALNEITAAIPEVASLVRGLPARDLILDGEAIAMTGGGRPHSFQTTMRRFGRKLDVDKLLDELPLSAYFFDCLLLNDRVLVDLPLSERLIALGEAVPRDLLVPRLLTTSAEEADAFYAAAIDAGHEGIMAKSLQSAYEAGNRGASWLKIKRAHTLDLVVLAAEWGHGRRSGKLSNLHLGALDTASDEYVMLGKTFKGLTDAMLEWQTRELLAREIRRDKGTVYVRPELVAEIAFSDLQVSPRYPGGIALRLARVKRYRDDKPAKEADTMLAIRQIFEAQG